MALQCGPLLITGTLDDVCFYRMHGKYYARMKSSLTRKRVLKDPKFQRTRINAATLGEASKIASRVYRQITGEHKKHALYREITGKAICLLREGKDKEAVFMQLSEQYLKQTPVEEVAPDIWGKVDEKYGKAYGKAGVTVQELRKVYTPTLRLQTVRRRRFKTTFDRSKQLTQGP